MRRLHGIALCAARGAALAVSRSFSKTRCRPPSAWPSDPSPGPCEQRPAHGSLVVDERLTTRTPLDDTGSQLLFRFVAASYEHRSLGLASHWPFEEWGHFLPVQTTAVSLLDRLLHHAVVVVTSGDSWRMKEARTRGCRRDV